MEFGKEYKKFGQDISPDRETIDRMKANVMSEVGRRRKSLPLGKIAVSCGSVAACAAIVITAAVLIPHTDSNNMTAGTNASSMAEISNEITTDTAADAETAAGDFSNNSTADIDQGMTPSWNEAADDVIEDDVAEDAEDIWIDDDMDISVPDNAFANAAVSTDSSNKGDSVNADDRTDIIDDFGDNTTNAGNDGSTDSVTDEIIENDEVTPDNGDSNYDFDDSGDDSIDFDHDVGDDGFDDEICDDSYDEVGGLGLIDKAKFSGDRNRLMIILHDGSRRSYTLTYENADMPEGLTSEYFIDEGAGTEYIAQLNGVYLRVNDLGNNFIALYRLDE